MKVAYTGVFVAVAFIAGAFISSPELRAYAAATITSADIVNGEVKNADLGSNAVTTSKINDGAVKTADIGDGEVKTADIADGTITYADLSHSSIRVEHRDDCNCGGTGWDPDGTSRFELIYDDAITPNSVVSVTITNLAVCTTSGAINGSVAVFCDRNIPNGVRLNYAIFNHP